jgi:hypothetical protein
MLVGRFSRIFIVKFILPGKSHFDVERVLLDISEKELR